MTSLKNRKKKQLRKPFFPNSTAPVTRREFLFDKYFEKSKVKRKNEPNSHHLFQAAQRFDFPCKVYLSPCESPLAIAGVTPLNDLTELVGLQQKVS
jgi:hypothetical protein